MPQRKRLCIYKNHSEAVHINWGPGISIENQGCPGKIEWLVAILTPEYPSSLPIGQRYILIHIIILATSVFCLGNDTS